MIRPHPRSFIPGRTCPTRSTWGGDQAAGRLDHIHWLQFLRSARARARTVQQNDIDRTQCRHRLREGLPAGVRVQQVASQPDRLHLVVLANPLGLTGSHVGAAPGDSHVDPFGRQGVGHRQPNSAGGGADKGISAQDS